MPAVGDSPDRANPVPNPSSETKDGEENPDQGSCEDGEENPDPASYEDGQAVNEEVCILYIFIVLVFTWKKCFLCYVIFLCHIKWFLTECQFQDEFIPLP